MQGLMEQLQAGTTNLNGHENMKITTVKGKARYIEGYAHIKDEARDVID